MPSDDLFSDDSAEAWPNEPDPPNEKLGPEVTVPRAPDYANRDVPPEVQRSFWSAVVLANVALGGVSLGLMLIYFQGRWLFGGALLAVGLVAGTRTWRIYRTQHARRKA